MNSGYKAKLGLTKENQKHWFIVMAYRGIVIKNWHHIIPKHHEGENSELVEVTLPVSSTLNGAVLNASISSFKPCSLISYLPCQPPY